MRFSKSSTAALIFLAALNVSGPAIRPARADAKTDHVAKANAAVTAKDWATALTELDALIALNNNDPDSHYARAYVLVQKQDVKGAIAELGTLIALDPNNAAAYDMRATLYQKSGDNDKSRVDFVAFLKLSPNDAAKLRETALAAFDRQEWETAINLLDILVEVNPKDAGAHYRRGKAIYEFGPEAYQRAGEAGEAVLAKMRAETRKSYEAAIKAEPNYSLAYIALDKTADDDSMLNEGLRLMPDNADLLTARALKHISTPPDDAELKAALADFDHALVSDPLSAEAYAGRARAYTWADKYDLSLADSAHSLQLKPNVLDVIRQRGLVYTLMRDYTHATAEYERALALQPDDRNRLFDLFLTARELPDKSRAFEVIAKLIEANPGFDIYLSQRAKLFLAKKDYDAALADADKALEINPNSEDAKALRAKILAAKG